VQCLPVLRARHRYNPSGGDIRGVIKTLILSNEYLETEVRDLQTAVSMATLLLDKHDERCVIERDFTLKFICQIPFLGCRGSFGP